MRGERHVLAQRAQELTIAAAEGIRFETGRNEHAEKFFFDHERHGCHRDGQDHEEIHEPENVRDGTVAVLAHVTAVVRDEKDRDTLVEKRVSRYADWGDRLAARRAAQEKKAKQPAGPE